MAGHYMSIFSLTASACDTRVYTQCLALSGGTKNKISEIGGMF